MRLVPRSLERLAIVIRPPWALVANLARVVLLWLLPMETNRVSNVVELGGADLLQLLAFGGQFFVNLDHFFRHDLVRILGPAHQQEVRACGQAFVTI